MKMFPTNVKQDQSVSFIVHVEQCLRAKVSQSLFGFRVLLSCFHSFLHQTGSSKNLFPRKTKT